MHVKVVDYKIIQIKCTVHKDNYLFIQSFIVGRNHAKFNVFHKIYIALQLCFVK